MLFTVYCCIVDQLSLRLGKIDAHIYSLLEHPSQEENESPLSHLAYSTLTRFDDSDEFLPKSFFRHNLDFVDLLSTSDEVHDDGFIDPNSEHVSVDTAPIEVKMERTRPRVDLSQIPLHRPPSKEYYAAKRRMANFHRIAHINDPMTIERLIVSTRGHGLKPGDSRYPSQCDDCDHNIEHIPRKHQSAAPGAASMPPGTKPGHKWFIDGGDATTISKWGGYRYFQVMIDAVACYTVVYYTRGAIVHVRS